MKWFFCHDNIFRLFLHFLFYFENGLIADRMDLRVTRNINFNKLHFGFDIFFWLFFFLSAIIWRHTNLTPHLRFICVVRKKFDRWNKWSQLEFVWPLCFAEMSKIWFFMWMAHNLAQAGRYIAFIIFGNNTKFMWFGTNRNVAEKLSNSIWTYVGEFQSSFCFLASYCLLLSSMTFE